MINSNMESNHYFKNYLRVIVLIKNKLISEYKTWAEKNNVLTYSKLQELMNSK